jgi:two-component system response regulator
MQPRVDILLVEDSGDDAELAMRALKTHNMTESILHVWDGKEAVDYVFHAETMPPKVILLDIKMPVMDGVQVLKRIKSDAEKRLIPVVMLTTSTEGPDIRECYGLGVNAYIVKPVEYDKFVNVVNQLKIFWLTLNQQPQ